MMWGTVCNKQLKLSGNTVGCYNAKIVLSNICYGVRSGCFCNTRPLYRNFGKNMSFNVANLFISLRDLHHAEVGAMA